MNETRSIKNNIPSDKMNVVYISLISICLIILLILGFIFSPWGNNFLRNHTTSDTLLDKTAKISITKLIENDEYSDVIIPIFINNNTNDLIEAFSSEEKLSQLLQSDLGLNDETSTIAAQVLLSTDDGIIQLKEDISQSHWVSAYKKYKELNENGDFDEIKSQIETGEVTDAKTLQAEASAILNRT